MDNIYSLSNFHQMPQLPFELVLEIAAFCAGSFNFNFKTFLNLAVICRQAHTCLKPVLAHPILVVTDLGFESGTIDRINGQHIDEGKVPEKWRNMQFVILLVGDTTIEERRKQLVRVSTQLSSLFPTITASIHQYDHTPDRPGAWSLVLQQPLPPPLAAAILRYLPLAFDELDLRDTEVATEAPELVTMIRSLSVHIFNHSLCQREMEEAMVLEDISPICVFLSVSPDITWIAERRSDAGSCLATCCKIAASYSSLAWVKEAEIRLKVVEAEGERRITFAILRQVSYRLRAPAKRLHLHHTPYYLARENPPWIDAALNTMFDFYMSLPALRHCQQATGLLRIDARALKFCAKGPSIIRVDFSQALSNGMSAEHARHARQRMFRHYPLHQQLEAWVEPEVDAAEDVHRDDDGEGFDIRADPEEVIANDNE